MPQGAKIIPPPEALDSAREMRSRPAEDPARCRGNPSGGPMHRIALCTALCALLSTHAPAAPPPAEPDIRRPLDWLIAAQNDDGSWGDGVKDPHPDVATT